MKYNAGNGGNYAIGGISGENEFLRLKWLTWNGAELLVLAAESETHGTSQRDGPARQQKEVVLTRS